MKKLILSLLILSSAISALACNVPVFRYALERWDTDAFEVAVLHSTKGLSTEEQVALELLQRYSFDGTEAINLNVHALTPQTLPDHFLVDFFDEPPVFQKEAIFYLFHPRQSNLPGLIWQAPLTVENVKEVLYSNLRKTISDSILSGTSIVWVLFESGDPEKDSNAWDAMQEALVEIPPTLELPGGITLLDGTVTGIMGTPGDPDSLLDSKIPLKLEFQALRLPRNKEAVLTQTIMSGFDLDPTDEPRVFSFFGQGRCLDPLTGDEINPRNFASIAKYLCGACSCEVKYQNPGIDLLMLCPWYDIVAGKNDDIDYAQFQASVNEVQSAESSKPIGRYIAYALLFFAGLAFSVWRSRRS